MPKPDLRVVAGRPVAEYEYAEAIKPIDVRERGAGVGVFQPVIAFLALTFVALLFVTAIAIVMLNLERVTS